MKLLIDGILHYLELALIDDNNKIINSIRINQNKNLTRILIESICFFLKINKVKKEELNAIYVVNGPGSFTSIKLVTIFANTFKTHFKKVALFTINTCLWNSTNNHSYCYLDAKTKLYYFYDSSSIDNSVSLIDQEKFNDYINKSLKNNFDFVNCSQYVNIEKKWKYNQNHFINVDKVIPLYIKEAI